MNVDIINKQYIFNVNIDSNGNQTVNADIVSKQLIVSVNISKGGNGDNGLSAYEIALENGFVGTESEWLESLKGQDGQDLTLSDFNVVEETTTLINADEFLVKKDGVWKKITMENLQNELGLEEIENTFNLLQTYLSYVFCDFIGPGGDGNWKSGNGSGTTFTSTQYALDNKTFGEILINTNTTASTFGQVYIGGTGSGSGSLLRLGNGEFESVYKARLTSLSVIGNTYLACIGISLFVNLFHTAYGYFFIYDPQNNSAFGINNGNWWLLMTKLPSSKKIIDTGILATTNHTKFKIKMNAEGNEMKYYIDDVLVHTESDYVSVPFDLVPAHAGIRKYTGTSNVTLAIDYMGYNYKLLNPR